MKMFLITFGVFLVAIIGMAVGVIISNKNLKGSCGGLGKIMGDDCQFCDKKEECDENHEKKEECIKIDVTKNKVELKLIKGEAL